MTGDACATCGHPQTSHRADEQGCDVTMMPKVKCPCTAYLRPRPVPEGDHGNRGWEATATGWRCTECHHEVVGPIDVTIDAAHRCATVPAPHAEAEAARLLPHLAETLDRATCRGCLPSSGTYQSSDGVNYTPAKPIKPWFVRLAGYLRGRDDRG